MITIAESQELIKKYGELKNFSNKLEEKEFKKHQTLCLQKFKYIIDTKISKYRQFSNYEDLSQEGNQALLKAMDTCDISRGLFFSWAHKHVATAISRKANQHSIIRVPMKVSKNAPPKQELVMPALLDEVAFPDHYVEQAEIKKIIAKSLNSLSKVQRLVTTLYFGIDTNDNFSINKISLQTKMSRDLCISILNESIVVLKNEVKI